MRQEESYTYKDFYREVAVNPSKTEKLQTTGSHLDGLWDAIGTAFYMGYAVGRRASKD